MLDPKERCSVSGDSPSSSTITTEENINGGKIGEILKKCRDCSTTTTPLWRGGPAGPKTLCNACGIKFHKKRRALLGLNKGKEEKMKKKSENNNNIRLKIKFSNSGKQRDNREVEQAAMLLMALSYGSVFA